MKFIRWGSLKPQTHDPSAKTFHTAPVETGIYAFPVGYVETFLLGGVGRGSVQNGRWRYLRDNRGKKIRDRFENVMQYVPAGRKDRYGDEIYEFRPTEKYKELFDRIPPGSVELDDTDNEDRSYIMIENDPIKFDYSGNVWCHFMKFAKRPEIMRESGSWILVDMCTYKKLLKKYEYADKRSRMIKHDPSERMTMGFMDHNSVSGYPISYISKDYYEVFIEKL